MSIWVPDASALATFRQNPEAFRLRYRKHLRPKARSQNAADAGAALHVALDMWFREPTSNVQLALAALRAAWQEGVADEARPLALMEQVVAAYAEKYPREQDAFKVLRNESYVEADIAWGGQDVRINREADPKHDREQPPASLPSCAVGLGLAHSTFRYGAILDRKIELQDGSQYVMDTKSTGSYLSAEWSWQMSQSDQLIGQVALERALGRRCDGFFVDAVQVRKSTLTYPKPDMQRFGPVLVPEWRIQKWAADIAHTLHQIAELEKLRGIDNPWPVYHNSSYGKRDDYWEFIETPPELHAQLVEKFEVKPWIPSEEAQRRQNAKLLAKIAQ